MANRTTNPPSRPQYPRSSCDTRSARGVALDVQAPGATAAEMPRAPAVPPGSGPPGSGRAPEGTVRSHRARGTLGAPPPPVELGPGLHLIPDAREVRLEDRPLHLTRLEFDLLHFLATRPDRVQTRSQILQAVWKYPDSPINTRTVDIHVARLRHKLGTPHGRSLRTVRGIGYRWTP